MHKKTVVVCAMLTSPSGPVHKQIRTFATTTGLLALADWLESLQVTHVSIESTGVYTPPTIGNIVGGVYVQPTEEQLAQAVEELDMNAYG